MKRGDASIFSIQSDEKKQIEEMISSMGKNKEFEVSFRNISYPDYIRIVEYYVNQIDYSSTDSLDIIINLVDGNNYRASLLNMDMINDFINKYSRCPMSDIQKYILNLQPSKDVELIMKDRGRGSKLYIEDYEMVVKLTDENMVKEKPELTGSEKILYRYKQRVSFSLNSSFRLDATEVQSSSTLWNLPNSSHHYELELEAVGKIKYDQLMENVNEILKVVQNTAVPIGKKESQEVIQSYMNIFGIHGAINSSCVSPCVSPVERRVISIEAQHIAKFIPNKYGVTDKADGERCFLISLPNGIYLMSQNMRIRKTAFVTDRIEYQKMILDGELIITEKNKKVLMLFDVIFANGVDYRTDINQTLKHRIKVLNEIVDNCFKNLIPFPDYMEKHKDASLDKIKKFYTEELKDYWKTFNKKLEKTDDLYITRKLYFTPYGIDPSEVFLYADLIWKSYVYNNLTPYQLDGIIYTPINSPYLIKNKPEDLDTVPQDYKWKPPHLNSFDFYIQFEKNKATGTDAIFFDNSGSQYKVANLFVHTHRGREVPIPFLINKKEQRANIYIADGVARDQGDKIVEDSTVVEFVYDLQKGFIPLRTRYDKTESVLKFGTKYGNHVSTAIRIWKTIVDPITEENIASLANPDTYQLEMNKISGSVKPQAYYDPEKLTEVPGMNAFHNWIKTNMISTYAYQKPTLLDMTLGRGGDLLKIIAAKVGMCVGVDVDYDGLFGKKDSAFKRYNKFKATMKNVPPMYFINANAKGLYNVDSQMNIIPNMSANNKTLIETYLSGNKKYSVINCQFSLHYFLSDEISWSNFCKNINDHLEDHGYVLFTCFDGRKVYDLLKGRKSWKITKTDNNGIKSTFCEIEKVYVDNDDIGLGFAINVHNSIINKPGQFYTEYLVDPVFLETSLKEKCGLELVESDSFFNIFNLYKKYFTMPITSDNFEYLSGDNIKKHKDIMNYYLMLDPAYKSQFLVEDIDANLAAFKMSSLNRYYVFKKTKGGLDLVEPARIVGGVNMKIDLGQVLSPYFDTNNMHIDPIGQDNINSIYHAVVGRSKPNVYLIRHSITEGKLDKNTTIRQNKMELARIKEGSGSEILLIYKSPDRKFHTIYHGDNPLIKSNKIIDDLNLLVELTEKFNN